MLQAFIYRCSNVCILKLMLHCYFPNSIIINIIGKGTCTEIKPKLYMLYNCVMTKIKLSHDKGEK